MLKKVITTAILGASAFSMMAANAAAPGIYVTGQLGYANTHMKKKTDFTGMAVPDGKLNLSSSSLSNNGIAGRLAIGYQFNQNFAVEMGYLQLSSKKLNGTLSPMEGKSIVGISGSLKQNAIDLVGKSILPVSDKFNVYGKLGVAYLTTNLKGEVATDDKKETFSNENFGVAKHKLAPEAALGVSYDITPNVSIDTSWTHIQPLGKNRPGNIDFVAVGVGYNFG